MVLKVHTSKPVAKMLGKVKIVLCIFFRKSGEIVTEDFTNVAFSDIWSDSF